MVCRGCSDISGIVSYDEGRYTDDHKRLYSNNPAHTFEISSIGYWDKLLSVKASLKQTNKFMKDVFNKDLKSEVINTDGILSFKDASLNKVLNTRFKFLMIVSNANQDCLSPNDNIVLLSSNANERFYGLRQGLNSLN
jgi:hypothetical protein